MLLPCFFLPRSTAVSFAVAGAVLLVLLAIPDGCDSFATPAPQVSSRPHLSIAPSSSVALTRHSASSKEVDDLSGELDAELAAQVKTNDAVTANLNNATNANLNNATNDLLDISTANSIASISKRIDALMRRFDCVDRSLKVRSFSKGMEVDILKQFGSNNSNGFYFRSIYRFLDKFKDDEEEGMRLWNSCCPRDETDWTYQDVEDLEEMVVYIASGADLFDPTVRPTTNEPKGLEVSYRHNFAVLLEKQAVRNAIKIWLTV